MDEFKGDGLRVAMRDYYEKCEFNFIMQVYPSPRRCLSERDLTRERVKLQETLRLLSRYMRKRPGTKIMMGALGVYSVALSIEWLQKMTGHEPSISLWIYPLCLLVIAITGIATARPIKIAKAVRKECEQQIHEIDKMLFRRRIGRDNENRIDGGAFHNTKAVWRKGMRAVLIFIIMATSLAGCATATTGVPFAEENIVRLQPGRTTLSEAQQLLGPPYQHGSYAGGQIFTWIHARTTVTVARATNVTKGLSILFDDNGTMIRVLNLNNINLPSNERIRLMSNSATGTK